MQQLKPLDQYNRLELVVLRDNIKTAVQYGLLSFGDQDVLKQYMDINNYLRGN